MTTRKSSAATDGPRTAEPQDALPSDKTATTWSPTIKLLASAVIALHVLAVFWAPLAFASRGSPGSPLTDSVFAVLRPYIDALYLNHGYSFFAPDVGPSQLVRYKVEFADGREPVEGVFPNLATQQPRLLYHRHFMLSEALSNRFVPAEPPLEPTPPPLTATPNERALYQIQKQYYDRDLALWRRERQLYEAMWQSFENHLQHKFGGSQVKLTRVEHRLALPDEVRLLKRRLDDPASYVELSENVPMEDVGPPAATIPSPATDNSEPRR
jgi:hypothetical protein